MHPLRLSRLALTASVALFFILVVFGNVTDYPTNLAFVQHVLAMDTTFQSPGTMWRAITSPTLQVLAYDLIIAWEAATAVMLCYGTLRLWRARAAPPAAWNAARGPAIIGLAAGMALYGAGFLVIAGEWFAMWQSQKWNGRSSATTFVIFIGIALLHLSTDEARGE